MAMKIIVAFSFALVVVAYRDGPVNTTQICGPTDTVSSGDYTLMNNIWNNKIVVVGTQCCNIDARDNTSIAWTLNYNWTSGLGQVKGFANAQQNLGVGHQLKNIASMPSTWNYRITAVPYHGITFNAAYDFFTAASPDLFAPHTAEIMVWTSWQYMKPVSVKVNNVSVPLTPSLALGSHLWALYSGISGRTNTVVYSFVSIEPLTSPVTFTEDMSIFFKYLIGQNLLNASHYLNVVSAGSEVIKALNANIKTSAFSININLGNASPASSTSNRLTTSSAAISISTSASAVSQTSKSVSSIVSTSSSVSSGISTSSLVSSGISTSSSVSSGIPTSSSTFAVVLTSKSVYSTITTSSSVYSVIQTSSSASSVLPASASTSTVVPTSSSVSSFIPPSSPISTTSSRSSSVSSVIPNSTSIVAAISSSTSTSTVAAISSLAPVTSTLTAQTSTTISSPVSSPSPSPKVWGLNNACLRDNWEPNNLLGTSYMLFNMTITSCVAQCDSNAYVFAGVEAGIFCYCGNSLLTTNAGTGSALNATQCNMPCGGDQTNLCGGMNAMQLYQKK